MQSLCMTVALLLTNNFYLTNAGLSEVQRKVFSTCDVKMVDEETEVFGIKGFKQSMGSQFLRPLHNTIGEDKSLWKSWRMPILRHTSDCGDGQEMETIPI